MTQPGSLPERPRQPNWKQFARLARFVAPYRARVVAALVALVVAAACVLALGQGLKYVVDHGFGSGNPELLDRALAAMIAIAASARSSSSGLPLPNP